ncbi:hypothetical protein Q1W73_16530 [Asticcacaulis sp. ZE23SCel15]|uniref:hypothetical protein n=1 Tax=Asticcacaulis sp. ZE23SCel15 TaxID=3059027 RepID=UPI0026604368|nr:hypothetical protein [Asticcacaulis sp. ZE23SCel15]WKL57250.1 hypothetical protein Q1W73_16530 [Asticcacaulis sp. ZE23SCel15]
MSGENSGGVDLFGDPWVEPKDARGRKRHKRLPQLAEKIAVLRASGDSVEDVALHLGLSEPTLRKYYFRELNNGPELAKAVLNQKMWKKAMDGNVSAANYISKQFEKGKAQRVARPDPKPKEAALGKKEQQKVAAGNVVGLFGTPSAPKRSGSD